MSKVFWSEGKMEGTFELGKLGKRGVRFRVRRPVDLW
jgi:hypothetical protein